MGGNRTYVTDMFQALVSIPLSSSASRMHVALVWTSLRAADMDLLTSHLRQCMVNLLDNRVEKETDNHTY